jgi:DNA-directed RNA polymerase specialized sigma24 family protein
MVPEEVTADSTVAAVSEFDEFVGLNERRLHDAMAALFGPQSGRDATAGALGYAWEHWSRVGQMDNPLGYVYVVARDLGRKARTGRKVVLMPLDPARIPWVEPDLPNALSSLSDKQRVVVMLLHCYDWTMAEVADLLGVSKSTIQSHDTRGMRRLRRRLGVEQ